MFDVTSVPSFHRDQDLLFSACGLSILSTIICTLSTVTCSIHIFSLDLVHLVSGSLCNMLLYTTCRVFSASHKICANRNTLFPAESIGLYFEPNVKWHFVVISTMDVASN